MRLHLGFPSKTYQGRAGTNRVAIAGVLAVNRGGVWGHLGYVRVPVHQDTTMYKRPPTYRLLSIPSYNALVGHMGIGSIPKNLVVPILRRVWSNTKRLKRPGSYPWAYIHNNAHHSTIKPYHRSYAQPLVTITRIKHPQNKTPPWSPGWSP